MDNYAIRSAVERDEPFLFEMLFEALFVPPGREPFPRSVLDQPHISRYVRGFGTREGDVGFVAETTAGEPIGAAWSRLFNRGDRGFGYVDADTPELSVAVSAQERGNGVGTALLQSLIDVAPRISLSVDSRNPVARLYERLGFVIVSQDGTSLTMLRYT
jgi:GNAT superfamily N-acetyltransferase